MVKYWHTSSWLNKKVVGQNVVHATARNIFQMSSNGKSTTVLYKISNIRRRVGRLPLPAWIFLHGYYYVLVAELLRFRIICWSWIFGLRYFWVFAKCSPPKNRSYCTLEITAGVRVMDILRPNSYHVMYVRASQIFGDFPATFFCVQFNHTNTMAPTYPILGSWKPTFVDVKKKVTFIVKTFWEL